MLTEHAKHQTDQGNYHIKRMRGEICQIQSFGGVGAQRETERERQRRRVRETETY